MLSSRQEFSEVYNKENREFVRKVIFKTLHGRNLQEIEDLESETFFQAFTAWPNFRGECKATSFLFEIATSVVIDWQRKDTVRWKFSEWEDILCLDYSVADPYYWTFLEEVQDLGLQILQTGSKRGAVLLEMRERDGMSYREIYLRTGQNKTAAHNMVMRTKRFLFQEMRTLRVIH